ncbi:unnamed protein product [Cyprideis torosa]|uniref:Uncharacterized protein n=1 Tax=Cyprideis torosa TaxID=163714 RepID=A0A7R8WNC9_9CRUS|nr:unnamed protein product [Cyprideis torosa]CAG0906152.1 unnamed protein product [Cyprideis torosa]
MPPKGGDASLTEDEIHAAVVKMLKDAGQDVADDAAPVASTEAAAPAVETAEAPVAAIEEPVAAVGTAIEAASQAACFSCHDNGVAGAPKIGDSAAWAPRIAMGKDSLYQSSINGKGAMPPKGGRIDLPDDAIKETVDYMISLSGG